MRKRSCYFRNKVVLYNYQKTLCAKGKKKQLKKCRLGMIQIQKILLLQ